MNRLIIFFMSLLFASAASGNDFLRGVVYDVGLYFNGSDLSVKNFRPEQVEYDMGVISHILNCNAVRIEGEDIERLVDAARFAQEAGLKIYFNPWKMASDVDVTTEYMSQAAQAAEKLRQEGMDITFVAGCEYSLFNKGVFPGETFDDRFKWLISLGSKPVDEALAEMKECNVKLNRVLEKLATAIRGNFKGDVTYSSGTWEMVDWSRFDIIGFDHYRHGESDEEYLSLIKSQPDGKPVMVLETGCCAYRGAAQRGGEGFAVLQGIDDNGNGIYEGGVKPERSEIEQSDYIERQVNLLAQAADGVFIYVFSYPIYPYSDEGVDLDMTSYALVKSFKETDPKSSMIPAWAPKDAFFRLGEVYTRLANTTK